MSEEQLKAFLEKVKADTSLQEKLQAAADSDSVLAIAKEAGFGISADDIFKAESEIRDAELEGATGGWEPSTIDGFIWDGATGNCCRRNSSRWNGEYWEVTGLCG